MVFDDEFTDAPAFYGLDSESPVPVGKYRTLAGDLAGEVEDESGGGDVLALRDRDADLLFHPIDVGLSVDQPAVRADSSDRRALRPRRTRHSGHRRVVRGCLESIRRPRRRRVHRAPARTCGVSRASRPRLSRRSMVSGNIKGRRIFGRSRPRWGATRLWRACAWYCERGR